MNSLANPWILLAILICHWVLDFICQPDEIARNKWHNNSYLLIHTIIYSSLWLIPAAILFVPGKHGVVGEPVGSAILFVLITFVMHTITDYITSRESHKYFAVNNVHNGFVVIGFDQILHYVQLYLTFKLLL